jgi:hypothetical protein
MSNTASQPADQRSLQTLLINDFSPGIYDSSWIVGTGTAAPLNVPGPFPAPLGAADASQTVGCMNLPSGGLGPLPLMIQSHSPNDFNISTPLTGTQPYYIALFCTAFNAPGDGGDELIVARTYTPTGGPLEIRAWSILWETLAARQPIIFNTDASPPVSTFTWASSMAYPFTTRVALSNPTTTVGQPVVVLVTAENTHSSNWGINLYPDPAAPNTYGVHNISTSPDYTGFAFGHQGRIVMLPARNDPTPTPSSGMPFYDTLSYTDPPNSDTYGAQNEVFGPENPYGYGAVSSVSAGELFMVKQRGGAVVVQGDLNNPTVTALPSVESTGPIFGHADTDPNGTYYCTYDQGAWVWNGGNSSTKISNQLDDGFFNQNNPPATLGIPPAQSATQPYGYFCQRWGSWMLFSNNWIYNPASGGWWRLYDPSAASFFFYTLGYRSTNMYAGVMQSPPAGTTPLWYQFSKDYANTAYVWQSLPIRPTAVDRLLDVREVTVRASNPTLDPNSLITVSLINSSGVAVEAGVPWNLGDTDSGPQIQNFPIGMAQLGTVENITVRLECFGTDVGPPSMAYSAPIVYDVTVQYRVREQASNINMGI